MKRKSPPTSASRASKRRKLSSPTETPSDSNRITNINNNEITDIISPLVDISNTSHHISPRPTQIIAKQLQSKRIMRQTKQQRITLTDDDENIIHEENDEQQYDFDNENENETEIGRGKQTEIQFDFELDNDPFAIIAHDITTTNQQNEFETISEHEIEADIESENERIESEITESRRTTITRNRNKQSESETDTVFGKLNEELDLSTAILSQKPNIQMTGYGRHSDSSMNISLGLDETMAMDNNNNMLLHKTTDNDSEISKIFGGVNLSIIHSDVPEDTMNESPSVMSDLRDELIERSKDVEEDEKALELIESPIESETVLSHTISQITPDETLVEIQLEPKRKTYSMRQRKKKKEEENVNVLDTMTPITRELHTALTRPAISTTRSRRRESGRKSRRDKVQILPTEVELILEEKEKEKQKQLRRKRRKKSVRVRGRSYSLLDEFRTNQINEMEEEDEIIDEKEDEIRQMILNQSGLSQQWDAIERERKKKRRENRRKLARYSKKKRKERRQIRDADFEIRRPSMSQQVADEYKEKENTLADFWREIETKMTNNEFIEDVQTVENRNDLNISGRRAQTPPRIRKHLERRYRKQYENMSGDVVNIGKKKGKRVWFCKEKKEVLNERQNGILDSEINNSLITLSVEGDIERRMEIDEQLEIRDEEMDIGVGVAMGAVDEMSLHSVSALSMVSKLSMPAMDESKLQMEEGKIEEKTIEKSVSVVSGILLPSIGELSSIMEGDNESNMDGDMVDPFNVNVGDRQQMDIDTSQSQSQSSSSIAF